MPRLGLESAVAARGPARMDHRRIRSAPAGRTLDSRNDRHDGSRRGTAVQPELPGWRDYGGTRIEVDHLKAATEGATVRAAARLVGYQGRFLVFEVEARSGDLVLGRGKVFRAIIEPQNFQLVLLRARIRSNG